MWYIYIIKSEIRKWYYVGSTNRLDTRIKEHNSGKVKSTKPLVPLKLVFTKEFISENEVRNYERLLKDKRILKESLIKEIENREQGYGIV